MKWSQKDEARYAEARVAVATLSTQRLAAVNALSSVLNKLGVVHVSLRGYLPMSAPSGAPSVPAPAPSFQAAELLIDAADQIRDLLEPFDSGCRAAEVRGPIGDQAERV